MTWRRRRPGSNGMIRQRFSWLGMGWQRSQTFRRRGIIKENNFSFNWWRQRFFVYGGQYFDENMKPLLNTKPGIRALQDMVDTIQCYPPGVLLFEAEEPKTMLIKGEVPMLYPGPARANASVTPTSR